MAMAGTPGNLDALPRTDSGKIQKFLLREWISRPGYYGNEGRHAAEKNGGSFCMSKLDKKGI